MNRKKCVVDGMGDENEFNLEEMSDMMVYTYNSEIQAELLGVELQDNDNKDDDVFELGSEKDMNDLAQASADNADTLGVVENIQLNQPHNDGSKNDKSSL